MTAQEQTNIINTIFIYFDIFMCLANCIIYTYVIIWIMRLWSIIDRSKYTWILNFMILVSLLFVLSFGYLFVSHALGSRIVLTQYGVLFIRPVIFLMGCALASLFKIITISKVTGGHTWTLRRPKS